MRFAFSHYEHSPTTVQYYLSEHEKLWDNYRQMDTEIKTLEEQYNKHQFDFAHYVAWYQKKLLEATNEKRRTYEKGMQYEKEHKYIPKIFDHHWSKHSVKFDQHDDKNTTRIESDGSVNGNVIKHEWWHPSHLIGFSSKILGFPSQHTTNLKANFNNMDAVGLYIASH